MKFDRKSWALSEVNTWYRNRRIWVLANAFADTIPSEPGTVVDIGCGDGQLALAVSKRRPDLRITGIDVVPRPKTLIPIEHFDGVRIPFEDKTFDYATFSDVLHHTTDVAPLLKEATRVARRAVIIKDHLREGFLAQATLSFMDWCGNVGDGVPLPYNFLSEREWQEAFAAAQLECVSFVDRLGIYLPPSRWLFDRRLQFIACLRPVGP